MLDFYKTLISEVQGEELLAQEKKERRTSNDDRRKKMFTSDDDEFEYYRKRILSRAEALKSKRIHANPSKRRIAVDMLERYTGHAIDEFRSQIILTNFRYYTERFNKLNADAKCTIGSAFRASSSAERDITIIEFGLGSAMAALVIELLAVVEPNAVLFLGMVGAVHPSLKIGDFILPMASIRAEGVSSHFLPPQVPALPTFNIQKTVSQVLVEQNIDYHTGTIHTTDLRFWEFDETFKDNLLTERVLGVEMETAALFTTGFVSRVPIGALLLVSDCPMRKDGIKTKKSANKVFKKYTDLQLEIGIKAMQGLAQEKDRIRYYRW